MSEGLHPGLHPDPDVLSAFLEGALAEHERAECLMHLADCAQCRELVFLVQEAVVSEAPAVAKETAVPFWRKLVRPLPVLVSAVMVVMVFFSAGLYRMIRSAEQKPAITARAEPAAPPAAAQPAQNAAREPEATPSRAVRSAPKKENQAAPAAKAQLLAEAVAPPPPPPAGPPPAASAPVVAPAPPPAVAVARQFAASPRAAVINGAGVTGTITDAAGAVVPRARVELKNDSTGATYSAASDARGQFSIAGMPPGRYDLSITSMGFQNFTRPSIEVQPQTIARLDSTLNVGSTTDTVTVTAESPLLKTESGALAGARSSPAAELPINGRALPQLESIPARQLPDKKPAVTFAAKDKVWVAADAEGKLFFSDNQGKSWKHVKGKWKGKVVRVQARADGVLELTTDPPSTWVSADGRNWTAAPASR